MEWTKCSEQLPPQGEYVIVCRDGRVVSVETRFWEDSNALGFPRWFSCNPEAEDESMDEFSHWMPLPEPPTP